MIITLHGEGDMPASKPKQRPDDIRLASVADLLATASRVVEFAADDSKILNSGLMERIPLFSDREIVTRGILGRGGFCVVRDIDKIRVENGTNSSRSKRSESVDGGVSFGAILSLCFNRDKSSDDVSFSMKSMDSSFHSGFGVGVGIAAGNESPDKKLKYTREFVAKKAKRKGGKGGRYVLKSLNKDVDKITYMKGNVDIAMEAKFLAALDHPHIIELVGMSKARHCTPGYFLILEKMAETLTGRIKKWMDRERINKGFTGIFTGGKKKENELYYERIAAAHDIAGALFYLHSKNITFRDLKPANVGFDYHNQLKLFDFGLAKELKDKDLRKDGTYSNMTAMTGAIRFMAPEVGLGETYNLSADVYSWSMVTWFILALEPPFGLYTENMITERVHKKGVRPAIFRRWNDVIGEMLRCAWDPDLQTRPNFLEITLVLKQELIDCEAGGTVAGSLGGSSVDVTDRLANFQFEDPDAQNHASVRSRNSSMSN